MTFKAMIEAFASRHGGLISYHRITTGADTMRGQIRWSVKTGDGFYHLVWDSGNPIYIVEKVS